MPNLGDYGQQRYKEQAQMLQMRGAQMVEQKTGKTAADGMVGKPSGTKKQLAGTVIGIAAALAVLILLAVLDVI